MKAVGRARRLRALGQLERDAADHARVAVEERDPLRHEVGRGRTAEAAAALQQQRARAPACRGDCRYGAGGAAADDDDVVAAGHRRLELLVDRFPHAGLLGRRDGAPSW
jgi:hypothetical protein